MASLWYPGSVASCWCGMQYVLILSPHRTHREAALVAASAEERKEAKYSNLGALHCFTPVAIETSGFFGPKSLLFVRELGCRLARVTGEVKSTNYLVLSGSAAWQLCCCTRYNGP